MDTQKPKLRRIVYQNVLIPKLCFKKIHNYINIDPMVSEDDEDYEQNEDY